VSWSGLVLEGWCLGLGLDGWCLGLVLEGWCLGLGLVLQGCCLVNVTAFYTLDEL